jgi:hypothetical protein
MSLFPDITADECQGPEPKRDDMFIVIGVYQGEWRLPSSAREVFKGRDAAVKAVAKLYDLGWGNLRIVRIPGNGKEPS